MRQVNARVGLGASVHCRRESMPMWWGVGRRDQAEQVLADVAVGAGPRWYVLDARARAEAAGGAVAVRRPPHQAQNSPLVCCALLGMYCSLHMLTLSKIFSCRLTSHIDIRPTPENMRVVARPPLPTAPRAVRGTRAAQSTVRVR